MFHYGGKTPKRHYMLANCLHIRELATGKLRGWKEHKNRLEREGKKVELVKKYIDGSGKPRWKGTAALKGSEFGAEMSETEILWTCKARNHFK